MANLPADLPTDWTQGQIISPNGTEVGLSKQHGYNYLNEQVNDTQIEVNSLNTAQTNTKQQVNTLNTQVGNLQSTQTTQSKNISTLQGQVNDIDAGLATKVDKVTGKGLSTNDFTTAEKTKLAGVAEGANKTTVDSSLSSTSTNPVQNKAVYTAVNAKATKANYTATLSTTWTGSAAPFTQSVSISGILSTDRPHITPVYSATNATAILEKEAWNCISKAVTSAGKITFTCFEEKPTQAISINIEIVR